MRDRTHQPVSIVGKGVNTAFAHTHTHTHTRAPGRHQKQGIKLPSYGNKSYYTFLHLSRTTGVNKSRNATGANILSQGFFLLLRGKYKRIAVANFSFGRFVVYRNSWRRKAPNRINFSSLHYCGGVSFATTICSWLCRERHFVTEQNWIVVPLLHAHPPSPSPGKSNPL